MVWKGADFLDNLDHILAFCGLNVIPGLFNTIEGPSGQNVSNDYRNDKLQMVEKESIM